MADWSNTAPDLDSDYASTVLPDLRNRDIDAYSLAESPTNAPTGAIRYNRAANKFQEWNGSSWIDKVLSVAGGGSGVVSYAALISALGLGSMAFQNSNAVTITGGAISGLSFIGASGNAVIGGSIFAGSGNVQIVDGTGKIPELSATYIASLTIKGQWIFDGNAPSISLANSTSNWIQWNAVGAGIPTFSTRSLGTKLILFPNISAALVDFALGIESAGIWQSVPNETATHYWYHGVTRTLLLSRSTSYSLPTLSLSPGVDNLGAKYSISEINTANAAAFFQSGEPGVSVNSVIISNNYRGTTTAASARINTTIGGSFIRLSNDGLISFIRIDAAGTITESGKFTASGNLVSNGAVFTTSSYGWAGQTPSFSLAAATSVYLTLAGSAQDILFVKSGLTAISLPSSANGTGSTAYGNQIFIGRNTSGNKAAGVLALSDRNGVIYNIFVDHFGKLRITPGNPPDEFGADVSDAFGVVVGTQT